jgi:hypothetical protein
VTFMFQLLVLMVLLLACESGVVKKKAASRSGLLDCESLLLYTGTDVKFESSSLAVFNPCSGRDQSLLLGQSSDAVLFRTSVGIFLVNRASGHQSIRSVSLSQQDDEWALNLGDEMSLADLAIGDPHDVVAIDETRLILANFVGGGLSQLNLDQKTLTTLATEGLSSAPRRYESLLFDDGKILALEQGLAQDYSLTDTQSIHRLKIANTKSTSKLVSIGRSKLEANIPDGLHVGEQELVTMGLCSQLHQTCQARIEIFTLDGATKLASHDVTKWKHSYFGSSVFDRKTREIYYSALLPSGRKAVISVDLDDPKAVEVFEFPPKATSGYWGLFYDQGRERLMIADAEDSQSGIITIIDSRGTRDTYSVDAIPYSGVVVDF